MLTRNIPRDLIGGARVVRIFTDGARKILPMTDGKRTELSREWLLALPPGNLQSLVNTGTIDLYPRGGEKFAVPAGGGNYDVVEGRKLNDKPLDRKEAIALVA